MDYTRQIEDVVEALKKAKADKANVNLLIGAGCSITGGIPGANGFVEQIQKVYPREYQRADIKDYANCMSKLTPPERKQLIIDYVKNAKINWSHIAIAELIRNGYANRVITTNFDNLVMRACSLVGEFPAVYDLATSKGFRSDLLFDKSIIHLHGQHTGFVLYNTKDEVDQQAILLDGIFDDLKYRSLWIIVGYSGDNDAVLELLTKEESFDYRLFWVGYLDHKPSDKVSNNLLGESKYAFYIPGYNADDFFAILARRLGCFPPEFIKKPFSYLNSTLEQLTPYQLPRQETSFSLRDLNLSTRNIVAEAVQNIESDSALMVNHYLTVGLDEELLTFLSTCNKDQEKEFINYFLSISKETQDILLQDCSNYEEQYNKDKDLSILIKWADSLVFLSNLPTGSSEKYLLQAFENYKLANLCSPNTRKIIVPWAKTSSELGQLYQKTDENKAIEFFEKAIELFQLLDDIEHTVDNLLIWGLTYQRYSAVGEEQHQIRCLAIASEKLELAHKLEPYNDVILYGWGIVLMMLSLKLHMDRDRAYDTINESISKFSLSYNINNSDVDNLVQWGKALCYKASKFENDQQETVSILAEAYEKLENASELHAVDYILEQRAEILFEILKNSKEIFNKYYSNFLIMVKQHYHDALSSDSDSCLELNNLAYELIINSDFIRAKEVLDIAKAYDNTDVYINATLGLWYMRNIEIELAEAELRGKEYYEHSIRLSEGKNEKIEVALTQKLYYELAKLSFERKNDIPLSLEYCNIAVEMGSNELNPSCHRETVALLNKLELLVNGNKDELISV